jgi:hypothetical protein
MWNIIRQAEPSLHSFTNALAVVVEITEGLAVVAHVVEDGPDELSLPLVHGREVRVLGHELMRLLNPDPCQCDARQPRHDELTSQDAGVQRTLGLMPPMSCTYLAGTPAASLAR